MARITQNERIIDYIAAYGSITSYEAFVDLGITRLASRVCDLAKQGYEFDKKFESAPNRFGEKTTYVRYSFRKQ